jgi:predicted aspartyl protease
MWRLQRPFRTLSPGQIARPCLEIELINPHTDRFVSVLALIDTGADECAMPAELAGMLGHDLTKGKRKQIRTGSGIAESYSHTVDIKIEGLTISNVLIDFMPNLHVSLLGVKSFLGSFILTVNYPKKIFILHKKQV